jgi:hypothetical protein
MLAKRLWLLGLLLVTLAGAALAGIRSYCTRPCCRCGIPTADYQYRPRSRSVTAVSRDALHLPALREGQTVPQIKRFQFTPARLTIDHCSIFGMELQVHHNGVWVLSLQVEQNPATEGGQPGPAVTEDGLYTAHLKRNEFAVTIRFYGGAEGLTEPATATAGKPALYPPQTASFWVQRGRGRDYWTQGYLDARTDLRELIDHAEIEFFYYR